MRLLSYNIHKGIGGRDRLYRIERIIGVIEHENPDLIHLQEVDRDVPRSRQDDQPRLLTERLAAVAHLFQLNVHLTHGGYGNLLLSRWPLTRHHQISLRWHGKKKPRGAQLAVVDTPEGPLLTINCHLGLSERERHWQTRHLLGHHLYHELCPLPTIIAGDFNDWRNLLGRGPMAPAGFTEATAPHSRFRSFPAWLPISSLDKCFVRGVFVREARVVRSALSRAASDHLPLVVDFHLQEELLTTD